MAAVVLLLALSAINVSEEAMMDNASDQIKQIIKEEQDSARNYLTITYNDFHFIKYLSFTTSGAQALKEFLCGLCGNDIQRQRRTWEIYRANGQLHLPYAWHSRKFAPRCKTDPLLTTSSIIIGFFISIFLALGKNSSRKLISKICRA
jgi:hypothetical protein